MKKISLLFLILFLNSCQNSEEKNLIYNELINYRNDLKANLHAQSIYAEAKSENDSVQRNLYEKVALVERQINYVFEENRYGNRNKLIEIRDSLENKYKANLNYNDLSALSKVDDSVFHKLIEIEFLRLRKYIQDTQMFKHHSIK